jgi:hypothetical protein
MSAAPDVRVWLVREGVKILPNGIVPQQDLFVLATSLAEAIEIVGGTDSREIVAVQEVCPITQTPGDRYRVTAWTEAKP